MSEIFLRAVSVYGSEKGLGNVSGVSFEVYRGECLAMAGRTYSGIRQVYDILLRLNDYQGSVILADGRQLKQFRSPYQAHIAPIDPKLLQADYSLSLLDCLIAVSGQQSLYSVVDVQAISNRFNELLEELPIDDWHHGLEETLAELSLRERVEFALLRALFAGSECLLLNRIFTGLQPEEISRIEQLLRKIKQKGIAILLVIDEYFGQIETLADRIMTFRHGKVSYVFHPAFAGGHFDRARVELAVSGRREEKKGMVSQRQSDQKLTLQIINEERKLVFSSGQRTGIHDPTLRIPSDSRQLARYLSAYRLLLNGRLVKLESLKDFLANKAVIIANDYRRDLFLNLSPVSNVLMLSGRRNSRFLVNDRIDQYMYREVCEKYAYLSDCLSLIERKNCYGLPELQLRQLAVAKWLSLDPDIVLFFDLQDTYQPAEQHHSSELYRQLAQQGKIVITVSANLDFLEKTSEMIIT